MKFVDVWVVCTPAVWDAIAPAEGAAKEIWHYPYSQAKTGYWNDTGGKRIYHTICRGTEKTALLAALEANTPGDAALFGEWVQGNGKSTRSAAFMNDSAQIVSVMKDHITYDQDGNPTGSTPATVANPNHAHVFLGQAPKRVASAFSKGFSKGFL